jgi:hypothetical protein
MTALNIAHDTRAKQVNGIVLYHGPSVLDGKPIVVIATGLANGSRNEKTGGDLIQTWIMRADVGPIEAVKTGGDASICGDCPHRGTIVDGKVTGRSCYVLVHNAPRSVWASWQRGIYPTVSPDVAAVMMAGRGVRLGAYGDPAAVPFNVWQSILEHAAFHTGYTHQWRKAPELSVYCMASADSVEDRLHAKALGFRTFRVAHRGERPQAREIVCPASKEAGYKTTCDKCRACGGLSAKAKADVMIAAHGYGAISFERRN